MRVRTDENVQVQTTRTGIIGKTFGGTAMTKENNAQTVPNRATGGKALGGLKGGARRAVLGDISNGGAHQTTTVSFLSTRILRVAWQ